MKVVVFLPEIYTNRFVYLPIYLDSSSLVRKGYKIGWSGQFRILIIINFCFVVDM